jgi:mono/diheme cytochrome c family protein
MMLFKFLAAVGALGVAIGSAASPEQLPGSGTNVRDEGRRLFTAYCSSCHGLGARGDGPAADSLRVRPADLTQLMKGTDGAFVAERVRASIDGRDRNIKAHGSIEMPVWGDAFKRREDLNEDAIKARIDALVNYLRSIQQRAG